MTVSNAFQLADEDLAAVSESFETAPATEIIEWAVSTFSHRLCLTSSLSDAVLIDLAVSVAPSIEIIFLDTQYHFPETLATLETVRQRYNPNLTVMRPTFAPDDLWELDTALCCERRKVRQLDAALADKNAWMSGLRRADDPGRAATPIVSRDRRGLVKINPIATWSEEQIDSYIAERHVPVNPLQSLGYASIGCWPCTQPVGEGETGRAGRWAGSAKTECGLHL